MNNSLNKTEVNGIRNNILGGSLLVINVLIVFFNVMVIFAISRFRHKNAVDIFVLSLAMCDLSKGIIPVPLSVYVYLTDKWHFVEGFMCDFYGYIAFAINSGSMLILTLMALERFIAVVKPFAHKKWVTINRVKIAVSLSILFTCIQSALPLVGVGKMLPFYKGAYCHFDYSKDTRGATIYSLFIIVYGLGMILIVFISYAFVFYKIQNLIRRHRKMSHNYSKQGETINLKTEKMFSYLTVILMILFWFSWLPFLSVVLINQIGSKKLPEKLDLFAIRVAVVNSILNPIAYASICKPYRRGIVYTFKLLFSVIGVKNTDSDIWDPWKRRSTVNRRRRTLLDKNEQETDKINDSELSLQNASTSEFENGRFRLPSTLETYDDFRKKRLSVLREDSAANNVDELLIT
ncbi:beta-2 adrenergic receptor [Hydra vulgaris]|uniref:beta-2 adrenergic receptor n=1 Tax=Hydra vulgaris TaxID=6087 RepID=UPI0006415CD3|nr:beta-2 adrenergic receptor [Hydra vulgaris]XP_047136036.1 beta-2 adrenergic receptor [Hydra vulgaris]XP_047136037.1 beta-2 adrenergic receptor [Hydra vulgaris]XP_047136038.1 beta-2 adrenergic receptor [Hydra vulgaris]